MALHLVATPIGDPKDITLRAIEILTAAEIVIGEERKEVSKLLKALGIEGKRLELLNEHSKPGDAEELAALCAQHAVALVSDCGTPGFCDPGANLVAICRARGVKVSAAPGASSLMTLLSLSGYQLKEFIFRGFLPAESEARAKALNELSRENRVVVLMDTPYRMQRLLEELGSRWPSRRILIGCDLTQSTETVYDGTIANALAGLSGRKAEFILLLFPQDGSKNESLRLPELKTKIDRPRFGPRRQGE